ncbi:MAG: DUF4349 domain-containing protein [Treponema sp.]|nr:DUF4349 domain-containing protein [Treponema sp.]
MNKKIIVLILLAALVIFGCNRLEGGFSISENSRQFSDHSDYEAMLFNSRAPALPYDDSGVSMSARNLFSYEGTGFNGNTFTSFGDVSDGTDITATNPNAVERMLVKRASIRVRVENLDTIDDVVENLLKKYNAYSALTTADEFYRYYSLRVPSQLYDVFLSEINDIGRLIQRNESTEDVTVRYYDIEGRLETQRELLRTFQSYLGRAANMQEILTVESRIADLQRDINRTGTQLRNLSDQVDYATIDLNIIGPAAVISYRGDTLGDRIMQLFGGFGDFLSSAVVVIIGFMIYGIPILAIIILLIWVLFGRIGLMKKLWKLLMSKKVN